MFWAEAKRDKGVFPNLKREHVRTVLTSEKLSVSVVFSFTKAASGCGFLYVGTDFV